VEQTPDNDLSRPLCRQFGIQRARSITEALVADERLLVSGVLIVAEHGHYPRNELGQVLYPRGPIFRQVLEAFRLAEATVPVFVARQLSHDFGEALAMRAAAAAAGVPLLAGGALKSADCDPPWPDVGGGPVREVVIAGHGTLETFGFDALEALHAIVERQAGERVGVAAVRCLSGNEVWRAAESGQWSSTLLRAALARGLSVNLGDVRDNVGTFAMPGMPATPPLAVLVEFVSGTRAAVLVLNGHLQDVVGACRFEHNSIFAWRHGTSPPPGMHHFNRHVAEIDAFLAGTSADDALRRALLATGMIARAMESHAARGLRLATPELNTI
jgi:hypothetical protein